MSDCKHPLKRYKVSGKTAEGYTCRLCKAEVVFEQPDSFIAFPDHAKMQAEAAAEREKLGVTLEGAAWVVKKLSEHMKSMGTYRFLIYERLGFRHASDAYCVFLAAGLMELHNHLADYPEENK